MYSSSPASEKPEQQQLLLTMLQIKENELHMIDKMSLPSDAKKNEGTKMITD